MTVWIRIALYGLIAYAYGRGWIGGEVRSLLTSDPELVPALEALIAATLYGSTMLWWKVAKYMGWST